MKLDLTQVLKDVHGKPLRQLARNDEGEPIPREDDPDKAVMEDITLKDIIVMALTTPIKDEKMDGRAKLKMTKLAMKIDGVKKNVDLTVSQISQIAKRIDELYPNPVLVARAWIALDYGTEDTDPEEPEAPPT